MLEPFSITEEGQLESEQTSLSFTLEKLSTLLIYAVPINPISFSSVPTHYFPTNDCHENLHKKIYIMEQKKENVYDWIR